MNRYYLYKALMLLGLCECLVILLCQLLDKNSFLYTNLQHINIAMYIPITSSHNTQPAIAGPGDGGTKDGGTGGNRGPGDRGLVKTHRSTNYDWLLRGPLFSHYNISESVIKKRVSVIIMVSSGPMRFDRRQAIRDTWWEECKQVKEVR